MKKYKNLVAVILAVSLLFIFTVSYSAESFSVNTDLNNYKIDTELQAIMESTSDDELIEVALWLSDVDENERQEQVSAKIRSAEKDGELISTFARETYLSVIETRTLSNEEHSEQAQTLVELKRDVEKDLHAENNSAILSAIDAAYNVDTEPFFVSSYSPLVLIEMTEQEIQNVANSNFISKLYYYDEQEITNEMLTYANEISVMTETEPTNPYPYGVWQDITNIDYLKDEYNLTGNGVKVGMLEISTADFEYNGIEASKRNALYEQFSYHLDNNLLHFSDHEFTNNDGWHGNYTLSILSGSTDVYEGVAPMAEIYCDGYYENPEYFFEPTEKMIDNGVNIISGSFGWGYYNHGYDVFSKYFDYIVSNSLVTICISAGNTYDEDDLVNEVLSSAVPYNTITVGNINEMNTITRDDDVRSETSRYNGNTNGPYKPDICAPGSNVSTYVVPNMTNGGTSAACPVVSGTCALLMEAFPELKTDPMLMKSLLMASAQELASMTDIYSTATSVEPALTRECGSGMIDALRAYLTYVNSCYTSRALPYITHVNHTVNVNDSDLSNGNDIYISLNWLQWNTVNGENWNNDNNYNVLNGLHFTLSLYDPNGDLVAVSDYQYDRKQFIRYKPLVSGRYRVKITGSYTSSLAYYGQLAVAHCIK